MSARRRDRSALPLVAGLVAAGLLLALGAGLVAALVVLRKPPGAAPAPVAALLGPSAAREGESWTHQELLDHLAGRLAGRGLTVEMEKTEAGDFYGPAAYFFLQPGERKVYVQKRATAQDARDWAALETGRATFTWGRFVFRSADAEAVAAIRAALDGR